MPHEPYIYEGMSTVWWATAIKATKSPLLTEINSAVNVTDRIVRDGLVCGATPGIEIMEIRWADSTPIEPMSTGFIVCRYGLTTSLPPKPGQKVEVWPVQAGHWHPDEEAWHAHHYRPGGQRFAVTSPPILRAVISGRKPR